jgi:threonine dehydratase
LLENLRRTRPEVQGVIAATRGNHGQSIAYAARLFGLHATVVVPRGNSKEKNTAMRALGAELVEHGHDYQAAFEYSEELARQRNLYRVPSFDPLLVKGVSSYALELFQGAPPLDIVYIPVGQGSGICGVLAARNALGLRTEVVGVVSACAPAYALSFRQRRPIEHECTTRIADGLAVRKPDERSLEVIWREVERIVEVTDDEIEAAMRTYFIDTHNVAEGAGAAALAAAMQERETIAGKRVAIVLSGGNVDREVFARVLTEGR